MKLMIIRHGDPNYEIDSLTPIGWKEAEALSVMMENIPVKEYYVSPLGRARDTASLTLKRVNREATVMPWLTEFTHKIEKSREDPFSDAIAWDWFPVDWMRREEFFDKDKWVKSREMSEGNINVYYDEVCKGLDELLAKAGYNRDGLMYSTKLGNNDTYVLFCHLGVECVLLSHLLNVSPMILWHNTCARPTSVTTLVTEERIKGEVVWRMLGFGEVAHLYKAGLEPSFAARFCETFENTEERH